jgi:two-component system OmpR family response regulator
MGHKKIFIVDDDEMTALMLKDHLSKNPLNKIKVFGTGEECIQHLDKKPKVIILDFNLNAVDSTAADGLEILKQIKKIDRDNCVIMLSSQEHYGKALQTIAKGALEYVVKDKDAFSKIDKIIDAIN